MQANTHHTHTETHIYAHNESTDTQLSMYAHGYPQSTWHKRWRTTRPFVSSLLQNSIFFLSFWKMTHDEFLRMFTSSIYDFMILHRLTYWQWSLLGCHCLRSLDPQSETHYIHQECICMYILVQSVRTIPTTKNEDDHLCTCHQNSILAHKQKRPHNRNI